MWAKITYGNTTVIDDGTNNIIIIRWSICSNMCTFLISYGCAYGLLDIGRVEI